jgi:trehalose 6-phosphate phosphatase
MRSNLITFPRNYAALPPHEKPRSLFPSWPEIRLRVRSANRLAIFLDFDGTLVGLRRRPGDVRVPERVQRILQRLTQHPNVSIAIVSGRRLRDLQNMIALEGVRSFGLHGAEQKGRKPALAKVTRLALSSAKRETRHQLGVLPGIWLEDKISSLAIHYRGARPAIVREANGTLLRILAPLRRSLCVINGEKVWEILPREFAGKGAAVTGLLEQMPRRTVAVYVGDDLSDESAFAVLQNQITVQVGRKRGSHARFRLRNHTEVLRFLSRLERELR